MLLIPALAIVFKVTHPAHPRHIVHKVQVHKRMHSSVIAHLPKTYFGVDQMNVFDPKVPGRDHMAYKITDTTNDKMNVLKPDKSLTGKTKPRVGR